MKSRDELAREVEVLGERIATLSAAVLRMGSSLDLAAVLQEAADSARTLYSLIVAVDEAASSSPPAGVAGVPPRRAAHRRKPANTARVEGRHVSGLESVITPICSRPTPAYRAALLEQVVARAGGDGRAEPSTCASENSESSSCTSCCRAQSSKLRSKPVARRRNPRHA